MSGDCRNELVERLLAIGGGLDLKPEVLEHEDDDLEVDVVVLDGEDSAAGEVCLDGFLLALRLGGDIGFGG